MFKTVLGTGLLLIGLTSGLFAETKIYKDLEYHQDISKLFLVKDLNMSNGKIKFFENQKTFETYGVIDNKLEFVRIDFTDFNFKEKIESLLKSGFRLKSIKYRNKFGYLEIKNVAELMNTINYDLDRGSVFDVKVDVILKFENILENVLAVVDYKTGVDKSGSGCKICDELNGKNSKYLELIQIYFTKLDKDN